MPNLLFPKSETQTTNKYTAMPLTEGIEVTKRFYEAIDRLIELREIKGKQTFCRDYDIDKRNFYLYKRRRKHLLNVAWLSYLVKDYPVSAHWLLTGRGTMIKKTMSITGSSEKIISSLSL